MDVDGLRALAERAVYPSHADFASVDGFLAACGRCDRARRELEDVLVDEGELLALLARVAAAEAERDKANERLALTEEARQAAYKHASVAEDIALKAEAERDALRASLEPLTPAKLEWAAKCLDYFDAILVRLAPSMNPPDSYEPSSEVQDELRHLAAVLAAPVPSGTAEEDT